MTTFPDLPPLGSQVADDPFWRYPSGCGAGEGVARLRVWTASGGTGHLAAVTQLGLGASITNSIEDIWDALRPAWPGELVLLEHWPSAESFGEDGEHLDQVVIGPGREPEWRRVWPLPVSHPCHVQMAEWVRRHGHRLLAAQ